MIALLIILFLLCYGAPTIIALIRRHKDSPAIAALNILLGWSVFGWFSSFIWSLSDPRGRGAVSQTVVVNTNHNPLGAYLPNDRPPSEPPPRPHERVEDGQAAKPLRLTADTDADTVFWDSMTDKNDPDLLDEYLIRFPEGRFARLAKAKLERTRATDDLRPTQMDSRPAGAAGDAKATASATGGDQRPGEIDIGQAGAISAPAPTLPAACACGAPILEQSRFCDQCGAARPASPAATATF